MPGVTSLHSYSIIIHIASHDSFHLLASEQTAKNTSLVFPGSSPANTVLYRQQRPETEGLEGERGTRGREREREKRGRAFHLSFISVTQSSVQCPIQRLPSIMQNNANPLSRAFTLV